jgi:hypothetical protein
MHIASDSYFNTLIGEDCPQSLPDKRQDYV